MNIKKIFNNKYFLNKKKISKILNYKLVSTKNTSTLKIISIWSKLGKKIKKTKNNYFAINCNIYFLEKINLIKRFILIFLSLKKNTNYRYDTKSEELNLSEVNDKIQSLKKILNIKSNFRIIILSKKLFNRKKNINLKKHLIILGAGKPHFGQDPAALKKFFKNFQH